MFSLFRMFQDWRTLGILPFDAERLTDLPAWVVDSFRVCSDLDHLATLKRQMAMQGLQNAVNKARGQ